MTASSSKRKDLHEKQICCNLFVQLHSFIRFLNSPKFFSSFCLGKAYSLYYARIDARKHKRERTGYPKSPWMQFMLSFLPSSLSSHQGHEMRWSSGVHGKSKKKKKKKKKRKERRRLGGDGRALRDVFSCDAQLITIALTQKAALSITDVIASERASEWRSKRENKRCRLAIIDSEARLQSPRRTAMIHDDYVSPPVIIILTFGKCGVSSRGKTRESRWSVRTLAIGAIFILDRFAGESYRSRRRTSRQTRDRQRLDTAGARVRGTSFRRGWMRNGKFRGGSGRGRARRRRLPRRRRSLASRSRISQKGISIARPRATTTTEKPGETRAERKGTHNRKLIVVGLSRGRRWLVPSGEITIVRSARSPTGRLCASARADAWRNATATTRRRKDNVCPPMTMCQLVARRFYALSLLSPFVTRACRRISPSPSSSSSSTCNPDGPASSVYYPPDFTCVASRFSFSPFSPLSLSPATTKWRLCSADCHHAAMISSERVRDCNMDAERQRIHLSWVTSPADWLHTND
jgi:hypothetical protein